MTKLPSRAHEDEEDCLAWDSSEFQNEVHIKGRCKQQSFGYARKSSSMLARTDGLSPALPLIRFFCTKHAGRIGKH